MEQKNLDEKIKNSKLKKGIGITGLAIILLGGAYRGLNLLPKANAEEYSEKTYPNTINSNPNNISEKIEEKPKISDIYRINNKGFLEVYEGRNENKEYPNFTVSMPWSYATIRACEKSLENAADRKACANILYPTVLIIQRDYQELSLEDNKLKGLNPEQAKKVKNYINGLMKDRINDLLEECMPDELKPDSKSLKNQNIF